MAAGSLPTADFPDCFFPISPPGGFLKALFPPVPATRFSAGGSKEGIIAEENARQKWQNFLLLVSSDRSSSSCYAGVLNDIGNPIIIVIALFALP